MEWVKYFPLALYLRLAKSLSFYFASALGKHVINWKIHFAFAAQYP